MLVVLRANTPIDTTKNAKEMALTQQTICGRHYIVLKAVSKAGTFSYIACSINLPYLTLSRANFYAKKTA